MTKEIFKEWHQNLLRPLHPYAEDLPGHRVICKSDGGPGRKGEEFLMESRLDGFLQYPGLPNGTKFQEMDNLFSKTKKMLDDNLKKIWAKRFCLEGEKAKVDVLELPSILFGGKVTFDDGSSLILPNAFAESLTPELIKSAREKCGYVPANRAPLRSNTLRHQFVETLNGDVNLNTADPSTVLLHNMEILNHEVVQKLEAKGYSKAKELKRSVNRISAAAVQAREAVLTLPGTTARQKQLMKASTAGKFFKATDGGAPMNCDDCLIALEMKRYETEVDLLAKEKEKIKQRKKISDDADGIIHLKGSDPSKWNKGDIIKMIRWKDPEVKSSFIGRMAAAELKEDWKAKYKDMADPVQSRWTRGKEKRLKRMQKGDIGSLDETGIYKRAVAARREYLEARLSTIPRSDALSIALRVLRKHFAVRNDAVSFIRAHFANASAHNDESDNSDYDDNVSNDEHEEDFLPPSSGFDSDNESYQSDNEAAARAEAVTYHQGNRNINNDSESEESSDDDSDSDLFPSRLSCLLQRKSRVDLLLESDSDGDTTENDVVSDTDSGDNNNIPRNDPFGTSSDSSEDTRDDVSEGHDDSLGNDNAVTEEGDDVGGSSAAVIDNTIGEDQVNFGNKNQKKPNKGEMEECLKDAQLPVKGKLFLFKMLELYEKVEGKQIMVGKSSGTKLTTKELQEICRSVGLPSRGQPNIGDMEVLLGLYRLTTS